MKIYTDRFGPEYMKGLAKKYNVQNLGTLYYPNTGSRFMITEIIIKPYLGCAKVKILHPMMGIQERTLAPSYNSPYKIILNGGKNVQ